MKFMSLFLSLVAFSGDASLGIGVDVLPGAYGFASQKIGFTPNLRLQKCVDESCVWVIDSTTTLTGLFDSRTLSLRQLVVESSMSPDDHAAGIRFQRACLAVVVLLQPSSSATQQQLIAITLSKAVQPVSIDVEETDLNASFFGELIASRGAARCGVAARSALPSSHRREP